jgi:Xaa-Pro dipeptidase
MSTYLDRIQRLQQALREAGFNGLALNPGPSLVYLTGLHFHLMERPVVLLVNSAGPLTLVLPELEAGKTEGLPFQVNCFTYGEDPLEWGQIFRHAGNASDLQGQQVGVEPTRLRFLELRLLEDALPGSHFISAESVLASLRMQKSADELEKMRKAAVIAQNALLATVPLVKVGMTERHLAQELTVQLLKAGSEPELPFFPIIGAGPNGANPHAGASDRQLRPGDLVIVDWGATEEGYFSDLTRTLAIGEIDPELEKIANLTIAANAAGRAAVRPGIAAGEIDQAAREVIEEGGYGKYFIHRTGHGLGMEEHEAPYIFNGNPLILKPGMTFTVEPGIYLPGKAGVRIEDNVAVTSQAGESLSDMPRDLIRISA